MVEAWHATGRTVTVRELAPRPMASLRLRHPSPADLARIGTSIGVPLPTNSNTAVGDEPRVIWMGPDEWLVIGADASPVAIEASATDAAVALCVGVGDGRCSFDVTGVDAAELLAKGTSIDLDPAVFPEGMSVTTLFAQIGAVIDRPPGVAGFQLVFDSSLRDYVLSWFQDAVVEFA